jgi:hypothetical protein
VTQSAAASAIPTGCNGSNGPRWWTPFSCGARSAGAGECIGSCLTNGFDGFERAAWSDGNGWAFAGGSLSLPADMMLERDMGSARVGGGACGVVSMLLGIRGINSHTSSLIDGLLA